LSSRLSVQQLALLLGGVLLFSAALPAVQRTLIAGGRLWRFIDIPLRAYPAR